MLQTRVDGKRNCIAIVIFNDILLIYLNLIRSFCWYVAASQTEHLVLGLPYRPPLHYAPKKRVSKIGVSYQNFKTTIWGSGRDVVQEKRMAEERGIQPIWCLHYPQFLQYNRLKNGFE